MDPSNRSPFLPAVLLVAGLAGACALRRGIDLPPADGAVATFAIPDDALLGPGGAGMLGGGDAEEREDFAAVRAKVAERVAYAEDGLRRRRVLIGEEAWELPVELVQVDGLWCFDRAAGERELLCHALGGNELRAIETLRELVDAQREHYAAESDDGVHAYARRWRSTPGRHDGLFRELPDEAPTSPLAPLFCPSTSAAGADDADGAAEQREPDLSPTICGYRYRILALQKPAARGGDASLADEQGRLTRGFAIVAWPTDYGVSGVTTFEVNDVGAVFQRDLGADTAASAAAINVFDPDKNWAPVRD
jgi:hypothetical protein